MVGPSVQVVDLLLDVDADELVEWSTSAGGIGFMSRCPS
jgi:hypothetical protein